MNLKDLGGLLKQYAPHIAGTLITGNPATGIALGSKVKSILGLDKEAPNEAVAEILGNPDAMMAHKEKIKELDLNWKINLEQEKTKRLEAELHTQRTSIEQKEESYRHELSSDDKWIKRQRPTLVNRMFKLFVIMVCFSGVLMLLDIANGHYLTGKCLEQDKLVSECLAVVKERDRYLDLAITWYEAFQILLIAMFGIVPGWFGSRGIEKLTNRDLVGVRKLDND